MKSWSISQSGKPQDVINLVKESPNCPEAIKDAVSSLIPQDAERASVVSSGGMGNIEGNISLSISFAKVQANLNPRS